jgi:hypothetical protein
MLPFALPFLVKRYSLLSNGSFKNGRIRQETDTLKRVDKWQQRTQIILNEPM